MFHIKPDKRSQTSAGLVVEGLHSCLKEKPFSAITITDVQKASTVGRATFYRLFDSLPDVLAYECDLIFQQLITEGRTIAAKSNHDAFVYYFSVWMEHTYLLNAVTTSGHLEILYSAFQNHSREIGSIMSPDENLVDEEADYLMKVVSLGMVGILEVWMKHGKKRSAEDLTVLFEKTLSTLYHSL